MNHEQFPTQMTKNNKHNKWLEILNFQPKLLWRTPTKIHYNQRRRRQLEAACKAQRTLLSTFRRQHCQNSDHKHAQRQRQNTTITSQMELMKRGNTDRQRFKKQWGGQAMLTVYSKITFFNATIGSSSYTICTMQVKSREFKIRRLRTTDTDKHETTHDQNHVTVHFSRVALRLR